MTHDLLKLLGPTRTIGDPWNTVWRCVMLAPNLETCIALLACQDVPVRALDPVWAKRFGLA